MTAADLDIIMSARGRRVGAPFLTNDPATAATDTSTVAGNSGVIDPDAVTAVQPVPDPDARWKRTQQLVNVIAAGSASRQTGAADDPSISAHAAAMAPPPDIPPDPRAVALAFAGSSRCGQ